MAYKWQDNFEGRGGPTLPKGGPHRCRVVKVVTADDKGPYVTQGGDPQTVVTLQDQQAREARLWLTCSTKAGWVLAKLLGCFNPPANLARLEADGVEPAHFANQEFAESNLLNREVWIMMEEQTGRDGKIKMVPVPVKPPAGAPVPPPPPPMTAPAAPPPPQPPPPASVVANTADEAWAYFYNKFPAGSDAKAGEAWFGAIAKLGKPQEQFTPADWTAIANSSPIPF